VTDSIDMSAFIEARSDQLNADDLLDSPRTITITRVTGTGSAEQPVAVHYEGENGRPFMPCKTVRRIMVGAWGKYTDQYVGRSMTLYRDPAVSFGGMVVGGIRVSHMSHIDGEKTLALQVTRGRKAPFKILPLKVQVQPADDQAVALKAITDAAEEGLDALANVWKQKWMAPHREALQVDLDRLKAHAAAKSGQGAAGQPSPAEASSEPPKASTSEAEAPNEGAEASSSVHPGTAIADAIIAEINAPENNAVMDVTRILTKHELDMQAMLDADAVRVEVAADKRRNAIRAEQEKAKEVAE
jgi:hypothetical protein